jgi:predicted restriction endonuclease
MQGGPCAGQLQAAHIIRRRYAATRTDLENAICLCSRHHAYLDSHLYDLICVTDLVYGIGHYHRLQKKADAGIAATGLSPLMFWRGERERLTEIAKRLRII